jgi:hypothetical protein
MRPALPAVLIVLVFVGGVLVNDLVIPESEGLQRISRQPKYVLSAWCCRNPMSKRPNFSRMVVVSTMKRAGSPA